MTDVAKIPDPALALAVWAVLLFVGWAARRLWD